MTFPLALALPRALCYSGLVAQAVKLKNVKVDGDLSDWAGAVPVVLSGPGSLSLPENKWDGPADLLAAGYVGWDERSIFVAALVLDDKVSCRDATSRDFKDSDYVRFYFDLDRDAARRGGTLREDDICVVLTPTGPRGRPMVKFPRYGGEPFRGPVGPGSLAVASRIFDGGYVVEARLPAEPLGVAPREGLRCGFQFIAGDTDDSEREAEMAWSLRGNYWFDPRFFGEVEFGGPLPVGRALEAEPGALSVEVEPRLLLAGPTVRARLLLLLPGRALRGRLLLRRPGEGAASAREVEVPFGRPIEVALDARPLGDGPFLVEFECAGLVRSARGTCLRGLWRMALTLQQGGRGEIERALARAALEALREGRPDEAVRALRRLSALLGRGHEGGG